MRNEKRETRKIMQVPISIYDGLADIAKRHGVKQIEWAEASDMPQPRIAELERLSRNLRGANITETDKRAFTLQKMHKLHKGLLKLLGKRLMSKELGEFIKQHQGTADALFAITIYNYDNPEFIKKATELLMPIHFEAIEKDNQA